MQTRSRAKGYVTPAEEADSQSDSDSSSDDVVEITAPVVVPKVADPEDEESEAGWWLESSADNIRPVTEDKEDISTAQDDEVEQESGAAEEPPVQRQVPLGEGQVEADPCDEPIAASVKRRVRKVT